MQQIAAVFLLNLAMSIDNVIVIGGIASRCRHFLLIASCSIVLLTVCRTAMISGVASMVKLPGLRLVIGLLVLAVAVQLATVKPVRERGDEYPFWKALFMVVVADLALSIENILGIAMAAQNWVSIAIGVFLSFVLLFAFIPMAARVMADFVWVQVLAAGLVALLAINTITDDPLLTTTWVTYGRVEALLRSTGTVALVIYGFWRVSVYHRKAKSSRRS